MTNKLKVKKLVEDYSAKLGIGDYSYKISFSKDDLDSSDCSDPSDFGNVLTDEETREVYMLLNRSLSDKYPEEVKKTIIHELLHVRFNELLNFFNMILSKYVKDSKARDIYSNQIDMLEHKIIVPLSEVLSENE